MKEGVALWDSLNGNLLEKIESWRGETKRQVKAVPQVQVHRPRMSRPTIKRKSHTM
jgi:hypothetical protein